MTCSLRRLIGAFASRSTLLFSSGRILHNSAEVGAHLGGHPEILCSAEWLFSLLAGNEDSPLSSQSSVCSASVERVTLHWVSLCCLDEPRHVGHMVFAYRGLICIQKHQVLCKLDMSLDKHCSASRPIPFSLLCLQSIKALFQTYLGTLLSKGRQPKVN